MHITQLIKSTVQVLKHVHDHDWRQMHRHCGKSNNIRKNYANLIDELHDEADCVSQSTDGW